MRASDFRKFFQGAALATAVAFAVPSVTRAQDAGTPNATTTQVNDDVDDDDDTDLGWIGLLGLAGLLGLRRRNHVHHVDNTHADTTRRS
jgi:MYXO-CTERM domain-containing protein